MPAVLTSAAAAVAGALLVASKRSVFTSGVMVGLAMVPSAAMIALGLVAGAPMVSLSALTRFAVDAALVLGISWAVLSLDRRAIHKRNIRL